MNRFIGYTNPIQVIFLLKEHVELLDKSEQCLGSIFAYGYILRCMHYKLYYLKKSGETDCRLLVNLNVSLT